MSESLGLIVTALTAVTLALGLIGAATRYVLLPWLREHLVNPVRQVEKQVTQNHHANDPPTILDRIDDVSVQLMALARMFDGHLEWSEDEVQRLWRAIDSLGPHHPKGGQK